MALHDAPRLYTLEVFIVEGPMTEDFLDENPVISRSIQIRGDQTLGQLHDAVFAAFDREDAHLYEFQIGGAGPMDPEARRYTHPMAVADPFAEGARAGDAERTTLESLGLETDEAFSYWFDFGDDWWHQIDVVEIADAPPRGRFPKVTGRVGASPPQYVDWDELEG
jgi:hypothetical protein